MFAIVLLLFSKFKPKLNDNVKQTIHVMKLNVLFMNVFLIGYVKTTDGNRAAEILCSTTELPPAICREDRNRTCDTSDP